MATKAKNIKLIAIDMDGTLLNKDHQISSENRKVIKAAQDQGIHVVISTGRTRMTLDPLIENLSLNSYLITVNGSEIWNDSLELIERKTLDSDLVEYMWRLKEKHRTYCWAASVGNVWRESFPAEDIHSHEWMKFGFDIEDDTIRERIYEDLSKLGMLEITNSSPTNLEINAIGVNKAKAVELVCHKLGFTLENVMAIGDSLNDIAMIQEAGIGVAMGNAQDLVKEAADWISTSHEEDGVAKAIKTWCL
ncbi:Cof-type HAD-IIB family hydrolase [Alkalihalobacillus hemicellulosilyticus]|uniref:Hydrolase n=1 Tax=Halalkalibacter hemicellulosilyticusJCM 9152 TaxID=1236971 RepID=W4QGH1_9BACI|nr:Cof-type HAD-IIB family hydrolase [Halalkalibacter hemicellulosilyticus]GAE31012.1 hydrolase [Halalkalibacter hemicellulosilyticusJCM 9152]